MTMYVQISVQMGQIPLVAYDLLMEEQIDMVNMNSGIHSMYEPCE